MNKNEISERLSSLPAQNKISHWLCFIVPTSPLSKGQRAGACVYIFLTEYLHQIRLALAEKKKIGLLAGKAQMHILTRNISCTKEMSSPVHGSVSPSVRCMYTCKLVVPTVYMMNSVLEEDNAKK